MPSNEVQKNFNHWITQLESNSNRTVFFCSTHAGADYDDYSSLSCFIDFLQSISPKLKTKLETNICLSGSLDNLYMSLCPTPDNFWKDSEFSDFEKYVDDLSKDEDFNLQIAVFGCSDLKRVNGNPYLKKLLETFPDKFTSLNFDHHIGGDDWATYNFVDDKASSNAENILDILTETTDYKPNTTISTNLMVGLVSDTLNFFASSASYFTHSHAGKLMGYGCNIATVREIMYQKWSVQNLDRLNELVKKVEYLDLDTYNWSSNHSRNSLALIDARTDSEVATLFKDECMDILKTKLLVLGKGKAGINKFGLSVRCLPESAVNASELAAYLGGGGHRLAAGVTLENMNYDQLKTALADSVKQISDTKTSKHV
ncbi:MAG: hypothetical protein OHK0017_02760 [Patescibacteria group bacterium]